MVRPAPKENTMTSLHRLIAIIAIWFVSGGVLTVLLAQSYVGIVTLPYILAIVVAIAGAAAAATACLIWLGQRGQ